MSRTLVSVAALVMTLATTLVAGYAVNGKNAPSDFQQFLKPAYRPDNTGPDVTVAGNKYVGTILGAPYFNNSYSAGQEVRFLLASRWAVNTSVPQMLRDSVIKTKIGFAKPLVGARSLSSFLHYYPSAKNYTLLPSFNVSGPGPVRIRVIAAHSSRTVKAGAVIGCANGAAHDVWAEFWAMAPRNLAFGSQMVFSAFTTFTVPPFNFRFCVKDISTRNITKNGKINDNGVNSGWAELENGMGRFTGFYEPAFVWRVPAGATNQVGDYAAIEVVANPSLRNEIVSTTKVRFPGARFNISTFSLMDSVKLVPWGYPCTYEKTTEKNTANGAVGTDTNVPTTDQYCGANVVYASNGGWRQADCEKEGSFAGGVARVGERAVNPFAALKSAASAAFRADTNTRQHLIAYLKLPAAGNYDICVSTRHWRRASFEMSRRQAADKTYIAQNAQPVWIKAYDASSSACDALRGWDTVSVPVASCQPRVSGITISAAAPVVTWATTDDTAGSWGEIKFTASSGTLNYGAATQWEHAAMPDYFNLTNGDQFRLVPEQYFLETPTMTTGNLATNIVIRTTDLRSSFTTSTVARASATYSNAGVLSTAGTGKYTQYDLAKPNYGSAYTIASGAGCFWGGDDNYGATGHFGNPGTQCCTLASGACATAGWCAMTDSGMKGPSASADLGGNPRVGYSPWNLQGTGANAWAYIRFPSSGRYRVCYRQAGGHWRVVSGTSTQHVTSNTSFVSRSLNKGYTFHFNDSRAETWGPVQIRSLSGNTLDKVAWNYYTASSATAVGSALKIVKSTESCYVSTAQSKTFTMNPGSMEALNALGSADDSSAAVASVYFYVRVPSVVASTSYRICFRRAADNWYALSDPNYASSFQTSATDFVPRLAPGISYTITDRQTGGWGKFVFNRTTTATAALNPDSRNGDVVRLVPNVTTQGQEVFCDVVYDSSNTVTDLRYIAQKSDALKTDANLDYACAVESSVSTDPCYTNVMYPTSTTNVIATWPNPTIIAGSDATHTASLDGTAAFITLPAGFVGTRPVGYKVCYKQARFTNWIEAKSTSNILTVTTTRTVTAAAGTTTVYSGTYTYIQLTATTAFPLRLKYDLVKLVPFSATAKCEQPAVANAGYELYTAFSGQTTSQCLVDGSNTTSIRTTCGLDVTATNGKAFMVMPTVAAADGAVTAYRVCYMPRSDDSNTNNWWDLSGDSAFNVKNNGIVYTLTNKPYANAMLGIKFLSYSTLLDTRPGMDAAKVVPKDTVCADATGTTPQPSAATTASTHQGAEVAASSTNGVTDVGPTDLLNVRDAQINVVLSGTTQFKVCYRPAATGLWTEVLQAFGSDRIYAFSGTYIQPSTAEVSMFTVKTLLTGSFSNFPNYNGQAWSTVAVGGASTYDGTSYYFTVTYSSAPSANQAYKVKFVRSYLESPVGTYTRLGQTDCFSEGIEYAYTTSGSTTENLAFNLPLDGGKYTVCVYSAATAQWYQAPKDVSTNTVSQPMTIVPSNMEFTVSAAGVITVNDNNYNNKSSFAGLAGLDYVYIINATGATSACGAVGDFRGIARDTAKQNMTITPFGIDSSSFVGVRQANVVLPVSPRTGSYVVCYYRSQAAATNTTGYPPFIRSNWYQIRNAPSGISGGGSWFLAVTGAVKFNISGCGGYNTTRRLRSGKTFDVTVSAIGSSNEAVTYALGTKRYDVTATGSGYSLQTANGECSVANAPNYGYTSAALTQYMADGKVKFSVTALSACPSSGCTVNFVSSSAGLASPSCTFNVLPTSVFAVQVNAIAATCNMGDWCQFRALALHADGGIAYTVNSAVAITVSGWTAAQADAQTLSGSSFSINGGSASFVNGVLDFKVRFRPNGYTTTQVDTVSMIATASGKTSTAATFSLYHPILSGVHIVDLYPVASNGAPILALQPTWEPTTATGWRGFDGLYLGTNTISAASGYHLVAGQAYTVVFRAVATTNGVQAYAQFDNIVPSSFAINLDSTFATALNTLGNAIYTGVANTESDTTTFTSVSWPQSQTSQAITLRFRNSVGCNNRFSGCTIPFTLTGSGISTLSASITTPVRSIATKLQVACGTTAASVAVNGAPSTCTNVPSTVNQGWYVNATAVDNWGVIDPYFEGQILAVMSAKAQQAASAQGIALTTVSTIVNNGVATNYVTATASSGTAVFSGLTVSRPCPAGVCDLQLMSTWGTDVTVVGGLVAVKNTARLVATLNTVLPYCSAAGTDCATIAGVSLANTTNPLSLIYRDTRVCVDVAAVDANGNPTLYDTHWILYYARDVTADGTTQALTLTDDKSNTGFVQRYKALVNSKVTFCFTISGFISYRKVSITFAAQRFGTATSGDWTQGANGQATIGPMGVWPRKLIAGVLLSSTSVGDIVTPGTATPVVSVAFPTMGQKLTVGLTFILKDHYNVTVVPGDLVPADLVKYLQMRQTAGMGLVTVLGDTKIRGTSNATLLTTGTTVNVTSATIQAAVQFDGACLGCRIYFDLVDQGQVWSTIIGKTGSMTYLGSNVTFYLVNTDATAVRRLAFNPSTNPYSYWRNGTASLATTTNSVPTYFYTSCFTTTCRPQPGALNLASCDPRADANVAQGIAATPVTITRDSVNGLAMRVYLMPSTTSLNSNSEPADSTSQVDILNTYTVSVSFGNQVLQCSGTCTNDLSTAPQQTLPAYGANVRAAIGSFAGLSDSGITSTNFVLIPKSTASYVPLNSSTFLYDSVPSTGGAFSATATGSLTVTGLAGPSGASFLWKPATDADNIAILATAQSQDPCNDTLTYACSGGTGCTSAGLAESGKVTGGLNFAYAAQQIPVGVSFPMTLDVYDYLGARVQGASGGVSVSVESWSGCNNGGAPTFSGSLVNGRATVWLTFTSPCESCVLRWTVSPSTTTGWSWMLANPATLTAFSAPIIITGATQTPTQIVVTAATPATAITTAATAVTTSTAIALTLTPRALAGRIPFATTSATPFSVSIATQVATPGNLWLVGNGGVLRTSAAGTVASHYQANWVALTATTVATVYFSRTCSSCKLQVSYAINGGAASNFVLPSTFTVSTATTALTLVGYAPRTVGVNRDTAVALWTTATDDTGVVGVSSVAASAATPSSSATVSTNGDGGALTSTAWVFSNMQIHRVSFSAPCDTCTVSVGTGKWKIRVLTTATYLKPSPDATLSFADQAAGVNRVATTVTLGEYRAVTLAALDDNGFVDQSIGISGCDFPAQRFFCTSSPAAAGVVLTSDGVSGGFPSNDANMVFASQSAISTSATYIAFGRGVYNMSFTQPQRNVIPVYYFGTLTSAQTAARRFPVPKYSVSVGTTALSISVLSQTAVTLLTQNTAALFHVALVGSTASSTNKFVAVDANNSLAIASSNCPPFTYNFSTPNLVNGYATVLVTFAGPSTGCQLNFTAGTGSGRCTTTALCTTSLTVTIAQLTADRFNVVRPTAYDFANPTVASGVVGLYAYQGRSMNLRVSIAGLSAAGAEVPATNCTTCTLVVSSADCFATGTASPTSTFTLGSAEAEVRVPFADKGTTDTYTCTLNIAVTNTASTSPNLAGPIRTTAGLTILVSVCKSAGVALLTNTTSAYRGMALKTGVAYEFYAIMVTAKGEQCYGDSQDDATVLTLDAIDGQTMYTLDTLDAINVNATATDTASYLRGLVAATPARTNASVVGGGFRFQVVFTNSTLSLGMKYGVRLAISTVASATTTASTAISGAFDTVIAAARLRFAQSVNVSMYQVIGRPILTGASGRTSLSVSAVDAVPDSWFEMGLTAGRGNIARAATDYGNNAPVFWRVNPAPSAAAFPISFTGGAQTQTMSAGRASWESLTYNGADGLLGLSVQSTLAGIAGTPDIQITAQTVRAMLLETKGFTLTSAATCTSNCILPNSTFATMRNASINNNQPFLSVNSLANFTLVIDITDGTNVVLGDNDSVVAVKLRTDSAAVSAKIGVPPSYDLMGDTVYARAQNGRVVFNLGFLYDTMLAGGVPSFASLAFSCPTTRPAWLLNPWESAANPCSLSQTITTQSFQIVNVRATQDVLNSAAVLAAKKVIKFTQLFKAFSSFNRTAFFAALQVATKKSVPYWTPTNIEASAGLTSCTTQTDIFPSNGDLGSTVCGTSQICGSPNFNSCPRGVSGCGCPAAKTRSLLLSRFLLQNSTTPAPSSNNTDTKSELDIDLSQAIGFPATTVDQVTAEYGRVYTAVIDALTNDATLRNAFQISSVSSRAYTAVVTTVAPAVTPTPPTPAPSTGPETPDTSSAAPLAYALAVLLGLLLAIFA